MIGEGKDVNALRGTGALAVDDCALHTSELLDEAEANEGRFRPDASSNVKRDPDGNFASGIEADNRLGRGPCVALVSPIEPQRREDRPNRSGDRVRDGIASSSGNKAPPVATSIVSSS